MGVGNSRLNGGDGEAKIRPMLVGKFEEFRKSRNAETTLSKKELLKNADQEDGNSQSSRESEIEDKVSSLKETQPPKDETFVRSTTAEKLSRVVPMPNPEREIEEGNGEKVEKDIDQNQDKVIHVIQIVEAEVKTEEGKRTTEPVEEAKQENDDRDDDDDDSHELNRVICPGSPSFRIYCIEAEKGNEEDCMKPSIVVHQKSRSAETVVSVASGSLKEIAEIESTSKTKGNKKKFGAMRTLLKVKSCYHPMCTCAGDESGQLVAAKSVKND
ncbi:uncharacterized protein LOC113855728 [Abrus precatorius]|uniref:Uncharacterized protein LOC113855728 n=1 Tax=Abrus precatorius TaxID=3816 RepID=A0A8B8KIS0_ABRPR|nr:uncharacterized protein LOC113855728 [Abrus precatorius]